MHKSQLALYNWSTMHNEVTQWRTNHCKIHRSRRGAAGTSLKRFLASVNIFVDQSEKDNVICSLAKIENAEEIYEVAGEYDIVSLISASCLEEFRDVLQKKIMKIKGIKSTITTIILEPHKGSKCQNKTVNVSTLK